MARLVSFAAVVRGFVVAGLAALASTAAGAATPTALVTILEGGGRIYRGTERLVLANATALQVDDLVETTGDPAGFAQLEFGDDTVVLLAPGARIQVGAPRARRANRPALFLLSGWVKVSRRGGAETPAPGLATAVFDVVDATGTFVAHVDPNRPLAYVEAGTARVLPATPRATPLVLAEDGYVDFKLGSSSGRTPVAAHHPPADFRTQLPAPLRDGYPLRWAQVLDKARPAKPDGTFVYADVSAWMATDPAIRRQLAVRWRAKAGNPVFRAAVLEHIYAHPEWEPIVMPKEPPATATAASGIPPR